MKSIYNNNDVSLNIKIKHLKILKFIVESELENVNDIHERKRISYTQLDDLNSIINYTLYESKKRSVK